jgi:ubiquinone/menaquinone biosynthesis C-methylase UbiE
VDGTDLRGTLASAHLLRTLAAVAPGARIVDLTCGAGAHAEALARLGFDVWACDEPADRVDATRDRLAPLVGDAEVRVTRARAGALGYPDAYAAWVVATALDAADLPDALAEAARVLVPGGWLWAEVPAADALALAKAADAAGLAVAEAQTRDEERGTVRAIYRRPGTVG